jgi:hypothetical protein
MAPVLRVTVEPEAAAGAVVEVEVGNVVLDGDEIEVINVLVGVVLDGLV